MSHDSKSSVIAPLVGCTIMAIITGAVAFYLFTGVGLFMDGSSSGRRAARGAAWLTIFGGISGIVCIVSVVVAIMVIAKAIRGEDSSEENEALRRERQYYANMPRPKD